MKKIISILLLFAIILSGKGYCQVMGKKAEKYYLAANEALKNNQYKQADSLFSLALKQGKHKDIYLNRAIARLRMGDSVGSCSDINEARRLNNTEADDLFFLTYFLRDTVYYDDNNKETADLIHCNSYEITETSICDHIVTKKKVNRAKDGYFYMPLYGGMGVILMKDLRSTIPTFEGGREELLRMIRTYTKYPPEARENSVQGNIDVAFTITEDGTLANLHVEHGIPELNMAAMDGIKATGKWNPGKINGVPASFEAIMTVQFRMYFRMY